MTEAHGRLRRLAQRIEREELAPEYPAVSELAKRRRRRAARLLALAEMTMDQIGLDPKATTRREMLLRRAAELELRRLTEQAKGSGHGAVGASGSDVLAERLLAIPPLSASATEMSQERA